MPISEFELIKKLHSIFPSQFTKGIGDDCAVEFRDGVYELFSTDCMVEGVHFTLPENDPYWIGWKLVAVNVSDIAAMGGKPKGILISWAIPPTFGEKNLELLTKGIADCALSHQVQVLGGDTSKSKTDLFLNIAIWGQMKNTPLYRSNAKLGDVIMVTGALGGSILGRHLKVAPRVKEMMWLANFGVHAAIDISDGIIGDLGHIAEKSSLFFELNQEKIPIHEDAVLLSAKTGKSSLWHAFYDGEDYEVAFTVDPKHVDKLMSSWPFKEPIFNVGKMTNTGANSILEKNGEIQIITGKSFEHQF